jgi:hypothetical protein
MTRPSGEPVVSASGRQSNLGSQQPVPGQALEPSTVSAGMAGIAQLERHVA